MHLALPKTYHRTIFFFGLLLMAIGLPLSKFLMSISQFVLIGNWIIEGDIKQKTKRFWQNKSAVILCSVFVLHLLGLLYTFDFNYGWEDLRKKLPLFIFPFIIASSDALGVKQFKQLMLSFVLAVSAGTIVSMAVFYGIWPSEVNDIRDISIFVSHIRFSLMIDIAIFTLGYYIYYESIFIKRAIYVLLTLWLVVFLLILNSLTGLILLLFVLFILLCFFALTRKKLLHKSISLSVILFFCYAFIHYLVMSSALCKSPPLTAGIIETHTSKNNEYAHDMKHLDVENGNYVYQYICWKELEEEWNKRSSIKVNEYDKKGNEIRYTILRYMTSKGLRKDADGVNHLNGKDIEYIQKGIANVNYVTMAGWNARICEIFWEIDSYKRGGNPSGHSITQRFEYWKTALSIIKNNLILGVGTGDVKNAFETEYERTNSLLSKQWRLRSHNQYLSIAVAFGIVGLSWFLLSLFYPVIRENKLFDYFYITFFIIALLSMLTEDTLETQAGVSFYVFFNTVFLFRDKEN